MNKKLTKAQYKKLKALAILLVYIAVVAVLAFAIYVVPKLTGIMDTTYTTEFGELETSDRAECYFVREEKVYYADSASGVKRMYEEGDLVRKGTCVAKVQPESSGIAEEGGIVSYFTDGYEEVFVPEKIESYGKSDFEKINKKQEGEEDETQSLSASRSNVSAGDPVFKIIGGDHWYVTAFVPIKHKERYIEGNTVRVIFDESKEKTVKMKVESVSKEGSDTKVILSANRTFDKLGELRKSNAKLITREARGLIIDTASLTKKDGQQGVYIRNKQGKPEFRPVMVLAISGKQAVIADSYFYNSEGMRTVSVGPYEDVYKDGKK